MRMFTRLASLSLLAAIAAPVHRTAGAQSVASLPTDSIMIADTAIAPPRANDAAAPSTGAPLTGLRSGVHARETARSAQPTAITATNAHLGQSRAMIVVGAAALITGAIIGGDPGTIFMVGGAIIGLYGLYLYLQ